MDALDPVAFARTLVDIDSTTGNEAAICRLLAGWLRDRHYVVTEQDLGNGRANLLATTGDAPVVLLSTHLDCVPPFFPSHVERGTLTGRGACDAKGILAAQVAASERLRAAGERRLGLLFVVGEERGSDGAKAAALLAERVGSRFLINGEPTESCLASATRGFWHVRMRTRGRAAHSAFPELGESAITRLIEALAALPALELPADPLLGRTTCMVALVSGGVAPNVVPPNAEADVTFRTVGPARDVLARLEELRPDVELEHVLEVPPERFRTVPGFESHVFPFTTDAPFLRPYGEVLLFGPGSARVAHTDHERIEIGELLAAIDAYERLARTLLTGEPSA
ncbi:MAG: M20/M25/M40 family metallo-hydrolase [Bacteroidales bacterium]